MHLKRSQTNRRWPIKRKGTKYVAKAKGHVSEGVPVVVALREMLKIAKTSKEAKQMVNSGVIKLNGKPVKNIKESVKLFNVLEAAKKYVLTILTTGRFDFKEEKSDSRLCKVVDKKMLKGKKIQLNLHDGTNILADKKINIGDSVELDFSNKVKNVISLEKGKNAFVISGRSIGKTGKIQEIENKKVKVKFDKEDKEVELEMSHVMVI